jgi:dolichol-phosphate mannosyltransferase
MLPRPELSVVIPVFNEEQMVPPLYEKLTAVLQESVGSHEIIFVDDGSVDRTLELLQGLNQQDSRVKVVSFSRNHGHQLALTAGLDFARGENILTMDADFQHPVEYIPRFLELRRQGYEIISGVKRSTGSRPPLQRLLAKAYYWLMRKISTVEIDPDASDFRLYSRRALDVIVSMRERDRYLRGMAKWIGFKDVKLPYECPQRYAGEAKYTLGKLLQLAGYGLFSFSKVPIHISFGLAALMVLGSLVLAIHSLIIWLFFPALKVPGYTTLIILIMLFLCGQFFVLGVMGEYIYRIYLEIKRRPLYIVDQTIGLAPEAAAGESSPARRDQA